MSGRSNFEKSLQAQQAENNRQLMDIARTSQQQGQQELQKRTQLQSPLIEQQKAFASGDRTRIRGAASPLFADIENQSRADIATIRNSLTGAERDFALAEAKRDRNANIYGVTGQLFQQAPQTLAALGTESGQFGLNQVGTGMSATNSSANLTQNLLQQEQARRAATLNFIGSLFGVAGQVAGAKLK